MGQLDKIETVVKNDLSWLQRHERLLLGAFVLVVVMFLGNKWLDKSAMDAKLNQVAIAQQLSNEMQNNEKLSAIVAQQTAQYHQEGIERQREIDALVVAMASRDAASIHKIENVTQPKTPIEVVNDLVQAYQGAIQAPKIEQDGGVAFDPTVVQVFTVTKIERDTATYDLKDQRDINAKQSEQIGRANNLIQSYTDQVGGLNNQLVLQGKKCEADITVVKTEARKSKVRWFKVGFITGFVSGLWLGHTAGL